MRFNPGDEVIVAEGDHKGQFGVVTEYFLGSPLVDITERRTGNVVIMVDEGKLEPLGPDPAEEQTLDVPVYDFGISQEQLQHHLEYLIGRSLVHVGKVGAKEAFFGYQEFEGRSAGEVLFELMFKLEEAMAMFAQAHIMIGRIVVALEDVHDQVN